MGTPPTPHLLLWAMTTFARVLQHPVIGMSIGIASIPMLLSGMARFVRVVAVAVGLNNPPWFTKNLTTPTTDGIELRLCLNNSNRYSNIALELLELYVQ